MMQLLLWAVVVVEVVVAVVAEEAEEAAGAAVVDRECMFVGQLHMFYIHVHGFGWIRPP
jgi:hypothetical protein